MFRKNPLLCQQTASKDRLTHSSPAGAAGDRLVHEVVRQRKKIHFSRIIFFVYICLLTVNR